MLVTSFFVAALRTIVSNCELIASISLVNYDKSISPKFIFFIFSISCVMVTNCELIVLISLVNFACRFSSKIIFFNFSYSFLFF